MRSTFNILFYVNKSKEKNGKVPVMGRVTINGTQSQFSCKKTVSRPNGDCPWQASVYAWADCLTATRSPLCNRGFVTSAPPDNWLW